MSTPDMNNSSRRRHHSKNFFKTLIDIFHTTVNNLKERRQGNEDVNLINGPPVDPIVYSLLGGITHAERDMNEEINCPIR